MKNWNKFTVFVFNSTWFWEPLFLSVFDKLSNSGSLCLLWANLAAMQHCQPSYGSRHTTPQNWKSRALQYPFSQKSQCMNAIIALEKYSCSLIWLHCNGSFFSIYIALPSHPYFGSLTMTHCPFMQNDRPQIIIYVYVKILLDKTFVLAPLC